MNTVAIQQLLALKSKAARGEAWSATDFDLLSERLTESGYVRVLAACCTLSSGQSARFPGVLQIVRDAIKLRDLPSYLVLSIYEALVYVEAMKVLPFIEDLLPFIAETIAKRAINLDNTLCLLGKLSLAGEQRASELLGLLACDADSEVRQTAAKIIAANSNSA